MKAGPAVGFVMVSWDCTLLIDERHQGLGYGRQVVRRVTDQIREAGADEFRPGSSPLGHP